MKAVAAGARRHDLPELKLKRTIISSFRNPASYLQSPHSSKRKSLVGARVGRYGLTVLYLEEDSWIDRATVAMAM